MEPQFSGDWFSRNIPVWTKVLSHLKDQPKISMLEIGSDEGKSACWLLKNILTHHSSSLTCIDIFEHAEESLECIAADQFSFRTDQTIEETFTENIKAIGAEPKVKKMRGDSGVLLRTLPLSSFHAIYINGSHRAPNVLRDIVLSFDLLLPSGILIVDDYVWDMFPGQPLKTPKPAIDAFLEIYLGQYVILSKGYQIVLRKISPVK